MKKFTIISSPEYEALVLRELGNARAVQLKEVSGEDFEKLKKVGERSVDYKSLYKKLHDTYQRLLEIAPIDTAFTDQSTDELRRFTTNPEGTVESVIADLNDVEGKLKKWNTEQEEIRTRLIEIRLGIESLRALQPDELKNCLAVGLVDLSLVTRFVEYLERFKDLSHKVVNISAENGFIFVSGPEERREWVETIFIIFEVKDIYEVLNTRDILLVLDTGRREEVIRQYEEEIEKLQMLVDKEATNAITEKYEPVLGRASFLDYMLRILSDERTPVLRTKVISAIQGWVPEKNVEVVNQIINDLQESTGELFFIEYEDPSADDHVIPTQAPKFKPSILQPAWTLTTLRGWPSASEINPSYITVLIFAFQFGLMFGDIGQGAFFLLLGLFLSRKYKRGMMSKLSGLFIPMGISAIIFGVLYDSIFLVEGLLFHHHQPMPSPVHETTTLMLLVFQIAAIEVIFGLILGAINQIKSGNPIGALGEHGLGMILYVGGLYLTAIYFIEIGMDFMGALNHWTFYVAIAGIILSFLEPVLHSVAHGHGIGMESIGEGVGGLLMTFVEGLANLFSFLRIAAFALAHASLAIAAEALTHSLGIAGIGLVIMNVIALSFEFVSSSVQSLRLLYYEFMGKFFHGEGVPFQPYRLRKRAS